MKLKKILSILLASSMIFSLAACGKNTAQSSGNTGDKSKETASNNKVIELKFWHSMGGVNGKAVKTMTDNFNNTHKNIHVTAQYQGKYDDTLTKFKTAMQGKAGPDICQVYDIGTRFMIDSGWVVPMQNFIDNDKEFDASQLEPNLLGYYSVNNKLYSMPFNSSTPILYYNKTAFKEVGLDPNKPPKTFKEIEEYSKKLVKKDGDKVSQYGFAMCVYGWFFEQLLAKQGAFYGNNENGRKDKVTQVEWDNNGTALNILKEWKKLIDSGSAGNFGRKTDDTKNAFTAGRTAMILESTACLGGFIKGVGDRFEIGTAYLPNLTETDKGGVVIGGGSLWAIDNGSDEKQKATWEFIKFISSPEQQVYWNSQSGYFPITKKAYDIPEMNEHLKQYPQFKTAIDQLHDTPVNPCTQGALLGVFSEARQTIEMNIEKMIQGNQTSEEAVQNAANKINDAIKNYNENNK
ncbi:ABC transporter substrate-binding protein [Clostridium ganghwense]|uniref:ABC transporter substrate-binding protein n=1 Tax=Clostridium ganghwense TaxID=312089 RepID=A0ABT4CS44_9CLOT|nr:ABC transporter substrate-binding protein [Clostridium ganghwense]MCY6370799.1 ABC transporter substrate-binding protein [Clostridium ganghwense]